MKALFRKLNREEGYHYEDFAYIIFGKCFCKKYAVERHPDGTAIDHDRVPDGWYILLNLPLQKIRKYMCTDTFEEKTGPCDAKWLFRIRKYGSHKYYSINTIFVWSPAQSVVTASYDDPYLAALNIKDEG